MSDVFDVDNLKFQRTIILWTDEMEKSYQDAMKSMARIRLAVLLRGDSKDE